jgi:D-glycero-D-manno-heptose 1,7-bisphosphate phosphatase
MGESAPHPPGAVDSDRTLSAGSAPHPPGAVDSDRTLSAGSAPHPPGAVDSDRTRRVRSTLRPAVFLDRDGVLIEDDDYVGTVERVRFIPGAAAAVRRLNDAGFPVVVVTNQAGVARGYYPESAVAVVHAHLSEVLLAEAGARIDHYDYSPYHPTEGHGEYRKESDCRKPNPGMLVRSAAKLGLDLARSWMVGDKLSDLDAGAAAGCRTILVRTGYGATASVTAPNDAMRLVAVVADVVEAVEWILHNQPGRG